MVAARRIPLIALAPDRIERETKNARLAEGQMRQYQRRIGRVLWWCVAEWAVGYLLGMLVFRVTNESLGHILLLTAFLVVLMGPAWTLIIWHWLEEQNR